MLGLPDHSHAFVVFQRVRQRCRSRVTDAVAMETARIAVHTKKKGSRDSLRAKERMCASGEREREEKNSGDERRGGRDMI